MKVEELNNSDKYQINSRFYTDDSKNLVEKNSIIFPKRGAAILVNKIRINAVPVQMDSNLMAIKPISANLNHEFLYYVINKERLYKIADTSTIPQINNKHIEPYKLYIPKRAEQHKIASFFTAIDQKISQLKRKKTLLEQYKKGVMQKIFSQEIRFRDDNGQEFPKWENKKLSEYLFVSKNKNYAGNYSKDDVLSVSGEYGIVNQIEFQGRSFAGESVLNYGEVETGDIVYTKSPLKNNPYGIIKVNKGNSGIVSTLYAVYKCKDNALGEYFDYYFQLDEKLNGYLRPLVHKGAKNDMKINNERVLIDPLKVPCRQEQQIIINFLSSIDDKIKHTQRQIEKVEVWKKGLMQQMFV